MAEHRHKTHHILLATGGKSIAVELFDSREWPDKSSNDGEFRVRIDGKWHCPAGKYSFLPAAAVGRLIAALISGGEILEEEAPPVDFAPHQRVRVAYGDCVGSVPVHSQVGFVAAPPIRGVDGRWHVPVFGGGGSHYYCCHDVDPIPDQPRGRRKRK